jgi:nicotinamide riboside transporter PnuC
MKNFDITWLIAIISITGSFFNIKKNIICFYFWNICEICCLIIDIKNKQYGRAFLDLFCFCMNIWGILKWRKEIE